MSIRQIENYVLHHVYGLQFDRSTDDNTLYVNFTRLCHKSRMGYCCRGSNGYLECGSRDDEKDSKALS